jgi:hypothetical protein
VANEAVQNYPVRTTVQPCEIHNFHKPTPHLNEVHHVWPLADGGPDIADNKVVVCPTGRSNINDLLQQFKIMLGSVPHKILVKYTFEERRLAELGWKRLSRGEL